MPNQQTERRLDEIHEYIRHLFQLLVGWFTFFVTVNYASLGWLAAANADGKNSLASFAWLVPVMFIIQNLLGLAACYYVWLALRDYDERVFNLEKSIVHNRKAEDERTAVPMPLYSRVILLMALSLLTIASVWGGVFYLLPSG